MHNPAAVIPRSPSNVDHAPSAAFDSANLTRRQYRFWLEQQMTPDTPVQRNFRATRLPHSLAIHLDRAWHIVATAVDAARARLRVHDGVPYIEFGEAYEPLTVDRFVSGDHHGKSIESWALSRWVTFHKDDFLIRHALLQDGDDQYYWVNTVSHLVCHGRSFDLLYAEMVRVMRCLANVNWQQLTPFRRWHTTWPLSVQGMMPTRTMRLSGP